jgi:hypothetical protein
MANLWARYQTNTTTNLSTNHTTFPQDVAELIARYQTGYYHIEGPELHPGAQQTLPEHIYQAILDKFPQIKDRLASPITTPLAVSTFWSAHKRDSLFGAQYDTYSTQWTGNSLAHLEHTTEATTKAISWALRSAQATPQPTLTIIMAYLPRTKGAAQTPPEPYYQRWIDKFPDQCKLHITLEANQAKFLQPNIWDMAHPTTSTQQTKCAVLVIANAAGFTTCPQ